MAKGPKLGDNRLKAIDPLKLLVVEIDEIAPLLEMQYPPAYQTQ